MCDFKPGDEVVCVDASCRPGRIWMHGTAPVEGTVYTVSGFGRSSHDGSVVLVLNEIKNVISHGGYRPTRFRKVQKRNSSLTYESFLTIKPGFEEPRRTITPAKENA